MTDQPPLSADDESDHTVGGTLKVDQPAPLPQVLDLLIAGGGPGGTAAALRAREIGLSVLLVEYDDLLKRIRDFPEGKEILASYGKSDGPFPPGGAMVASLVFDETTKDELEAAYKQKYKQFNVAARIGNEFIGLERAADAWQVRTWNHRTRAETTYTARGVVLALGAGVPRRFDIPGNLDGLAFRLDRAAHYVGGPALVIGGGISAAEAVIAISNAKTAAKDASSVYWSYRGESLPRVAESKNLASRFYDAYVGNGNIRYLPGSEPAAVFRGPDKRDYLSVRVDRKMIAGRPIESVHLEFAKDSVVACIGEEVPYRLVQSLGAKVPLIKGVPMMLLSADGELSLPNVFLIGDARGQDYLRCSDFADPATYEVVSERDNIKAAMWEGVLAVETLALRLGHADAGVARAAASLPAGAPLPAAASALASATPAAAPAKSAAGPSAAPPPFVTPAKPAEQQPAAAVGAAIAQLLPDGSLDQRLPLAKPVVTIGRSDADIACPEDVYMAKRHATLTQRDDVWWLEDAGTDSGTWLRVPTDVVGRALSENDQLWIGSQTLLVTKADSRWGLAHYDAQGAFRATHVVGDTGMFVGRASEVPLDAADESLSRRHAQFRIVDGALRVFDLNSTNGTMVRVTTPLALQPGDQFRIGDKRFRFEHGAAVRAVAAADVIVDAPVPAAAAPSAPAAAAGDGPAVTFEHPEFPCTFSAHSGQDLLHAFFDHLRQRYPAMKCSKSGEPREHQDEPIGWECKVGVCGYCVVRIVAGAEQFEPISAGSPELDTLKNKVRVEPDPQRYRLACLARIKGPVTLGPK